MNTERKVISASEADTERIGGELAKSLPPGSVVLLNGELGAGKTVFSRGFARALGITEPVSSPTYTIVQEYRLPAGGRLYHLDLYRIGNVNAALNFGIDEFLDDPEGIALIEWPERAAGILPQSAVVVELKHLDAEHREITVRQKC